MKRFEVLYEHVALLTSGRTYVEFDEWTETGAPIINPKRPYGNSDVVGDIIEILEVEVYWDEDDDVPEAVWDEMMEFHKGTAQALEIILATKSFEPGVYEADPYSINWRRVDG